VTLDTHEGALAVLVPTDHKIYARVASRVRAGHFWVVEADLTAFYGHVEIHARHVLSDKDTFQPRVTDPGEAAESPSEDSAAGQLPLAL
jgi:hypothetical protein